MWYIPFWVLLAISIILAGTSVAIQKLRFIDIQVMIMIVAFAMSCDMIFCKQYEMYNYVTAEYKGWYSFWANLVIVPALGLVFIKLLPKSLKGVAAYITAWTILATLFEIYIAEPFGILHYPMWKVFPYSTIGYVLSFTGEYAYYRILSKRCS